MKTVFILACTLIFVSLAIAQTEKRQTEISNKLAKVSSSTFESSERGIKEFAAAEDKLDAETKPKSQELAALLVKIAASEKKLQEYRETMGLSADDCYEKVILKKYQDELAENEKLRKEHRSRYVSFETFYRKRQEELIAPVIGKIRSALQQFRKDKGYSVIFDSSNLGFDDFFVTGDGVIDVTAEFIQYYNSLSQKP